MGLLDTIKGLASRLVGSDQQAPPPQGERSFQQELAPLPKLQAPQVMAMAEPWRHGQAPPVLQPYAPYPTPLPQPVQPQGLQVEPNTGGFQPGANPQEPADARLLQLLKSLR